MSCNTCKHWQRWKDKYPNATTTSARLCVGICSSKSFGEHLDACTPDGVAFERPADFELITGPLFECSHYEVKPA